MVLARKNGPQGASLAPEYQTSLEDNVVEWYHFYYRIVWAGQSKKCQEDAGRDILKLISNAKATERRIIAAGLDPKPGGKYRLMIIPPNFSKISPYMMRVLLRDLLDHSDYDSWGHVDETYYVSSIQEILRGEVFDEADTCKVAFLVEDPKAPYHDPRAPGSLFVDTEFGPDLKSVFEAWREEVSSPGLTIQSLNCITHSLLWLGDVADWGNALGSSSIAYGYVEQLHKARRGLFPYGHVIGGEARWDACLALAPTIAVAAIAWSSF